VEPWEYLINSEGAFDTDEVRDQAKQARRKNARAAKEMSLNGVFHQSEVRHFWKKIMADTKSSIGVRVTGVHSVQKFHNTLSKRIIRRACKRVLTRIYVTRGTATLKNKHGDVKTRYIMPTDAAACCHTTLASCNPPYSIVFTLKK
jgi:hypothetical protein